ncbi:DUF2530 domain-containing protein [Pseudonocardia nigra]|uniref:DUF2530 domain-containing protein n=1 Tax=Pseudonocardia nigra TaxID=1921578 RepID=UPI001C600422|nr:DUF2530 domain-containing protein [Pseudonocardia nigra]
MADPPPLPRGLSDVRAVVAVGTALWLLGAAALLVAWLAGRQPLGIGFTTCVAGAVLGAMGWGIFSWQRTAARRGSRAAQQGLE